MLIVVTNNECNDVGRCSDEISAACYILIVAYEVSYSKKCEVQPTSLIIIQYPILFEINKYY